MFSKFTLPFASAALVLGTFAVAPAQPESAPKSKPVTATGIVVGAPSAQDFQLRTAAGFYRIKFHSKVNMKEIRGGDLVRVFGRPLGRVIYDANVRLLEAKASDIADDYDRTGPESLDGTPRQGSEEKTVQ